MSVQSFTPKAVGGLLLLLRQWFLADGLLKRLLNFLLPPWLKIIDSGVQLTGLYISHWALIVIIK